MPRKLNPAGAMAGACAVTVTVAVAVAVGTYRPAEPAPVTRAEAEALLDRTVALAQAGDFDSFCEAVSTRDGICRNLLASARDMGVTPGNVPEIVGSSWIDDTLVLHLRGVTGENRPYTADFAVVRERAESGVRAATPVYWSGVTYSA